MIRTQISVDADLYAKARATARRKGISLAELCRRGLEEAVAREPSDKPWMKYAGTLHGRQVRQKWEANTTIVFCASDVGQPPLARILQDDRKGSRSPRSRTSGGPRSGLWVCSDRQALSPGPGSSDLRRICNPSPQPGHPGGQEPAVDSKPAPEIPGENLVVGV